MPKDINDRPLTLGDIHEVLIPAMEKVFATKKDLEAFEQRALEVFATKQDLEALDQKVREVLVNQDAMLKDLEILKDEKTVREYQEEKQQQLWGIVIEALQEHDILSPEQLEQIEQLGVL